MYVGEMILLSGHLYRFGSGFFFHGIGSIVLAPVDLLIILLSGAICALLLTAISEGKKRNVSWIAIAIIACIIAGCLLSKPGSMSGMVNESNRADLTSGPYMIYYFNDSPDPIKPSFRLYQESSTFQFTYSALSSYFAVGKYKLTGTGLVLETDDGLNTYRFNVDENGRFMFDAGSSSKIPKYSYSSGGTAQSPVPDGAAFSWVIPSDNSVVAFQAAYGNIVADIDDDGKSETCSMGYGPTSGLFTFTLTVMEDGVLEYFNIYNTEFYNLSFIKASDGVIKVQGIRQGDNPKVHLFDISVKDGNIVLSEDGKALEYIGEQGITSKFLN